MKSSNTNNWLDKLLQHNEISALSYYFASFIAKQSGSARDSLLVLSAALLSERNLQQGDVCVDLEDYRDRPLFITEQIELRDSPQGIAPEQWIEQLEKSHCVARPGQMAPLIIDGSRLYLGRFWSYEQRLLQAINQRSKMIDGLDKQSLTENLDRLFPVVKENKGADWQKLAVALAASRHFAVISGGPGTGKTTTVIKLLALLLIQNPEMQIRLAAPTGKAAARMAESIQNLKGEIDIDPAIAGLIPDRASTIHRLLGYARQGFQYNRENPLAVDCIVIDEASMIDLPLMAKLMDSLNDDTRVILLGDRDQLSSVDAGKVLGDITGHGQEIRYSPQQLVLLQELTGAVIADMSAEPSSPSPAVADAIALLRKSYRFSDDGGIGRLSKLINAGDGPAALQLLVDGDEQVAWIEATEKAVDSSAIDWAVDRFSEYLSCIDVMDALQQLGQTRILCALREGPFGVNDMNAQMAQRLQRRGLLDGVSEVQGIPIMITANDYEIGLFNGDVGLLWKDEGGRLRAYFKEHPKGFPVGNLPQYDTAWALTVHKSQGSEFNQLLLILPDESSSPILTRELLYTGVTRARDRVIVHAGPTALLQACAKTVSRSSGLAQSLGWG